MKFAVGLFVLTLFIAIGTFLYLLLEEKGTFEKRYSYYFETTSASSFSAGMPLKFSGFNIGVIDDIRLKDDGSVIMRFSVTQEHRKWIAQDSVLMIKKPLIGSAHIELYSAIGNEPLEEGSQLMLLMSDDINDMVTKLEPAVDNAIKIIDNIQNITAALAAKDSPLFKTLHNVEHISAKLANDDSLLTSALGDKEATKSIITSLHSLKNIMQDINSITTQVNTITSTLNTKLIDPSSHALGELGIMLEDINQKLKALDSTVRSVGEFDDELIEIKEQISVGLEKSNQMMSKLDAILQDSSKSEVILP